MGIPRLLKGQQGGRAGVAFTALGIDRSRLALRNLGVSAAAALPFR
jgi:hypothetical protein